jgi:hypothetical protein
MVTHPLSRIAPHHRRTVFVILLVATLVIMVVLNMTGNHLRTAEAPAAIVSYELAGTAEKAEAILNSWDNEAKAYAGFNLGFDYLWMPFYSTTIALGLVWAISALRLKGTAATILTFLAWGQWLAAILDAIENTALSIMLFGQPAAPWPLIAYWSATIKFALVIIGILIVLVSPILYRLRS